MGSSTATSVSVTETTSVDEFLTNAEAAQRSFEAERGTARIVRDENDDDLTSGDDSNLSDVEEEGSDEDGDGDDDVGSSQMQWVPRKPEWNRTQPAEEYHALQQAEFLRWKRRLARIERRQRGSLPPFEKNLDFWRQLWHIVDISDVVVQVVDARDPLFFHCSDLDAYVKEVSERKVNVVLMNKADLLTRQQRVSWAEYFSETDMNCLFFSAVDDEEDGSSGQESEDSGDVGRILSPYEVLDAVGRLTGEPRFTVGFLGYPNVGKSSTINRFLANKKLQVSATPGKTKHYQTHVLAGGTATLADGPGLVIPDLSMSKVLEDH